MTTVGPGTPHMEVDGQEATVAQLRAAALASYGHFTAMQVRDRRTRGLDLHVARLDAANLEVFGAALDTGLVRDHIRHALGNDTLDASVRVYVYETADHPAIMVTVRPPGGMPTSPWKLRSVPYMRSLAHIKHMGDFGQGYFRRLVRAQGFDEALLTGPDTIISEGSITNIGFYDGTGIIWPDAPVLNGITMQLLDLTLAGHGLASRRVPVRLADLGSFGAAFVTNARGIAPVGQVDDQALLVNPALMGTLMHAYESVDWDRI